MFKKGIASTALAVALFVMPAVARADWSNADTVAWIRQSRSSYDSGKTVIKLTTVTCSTGEFFISDASGNKDIQIRLLTSALLSGRQVQLGYTPVANAGCDVYSVVLK